MLSLTLYFLLGSAHAWVEDPSFLQELTGECDFPIYDGIVDYPTSIDYPFILRNLIDDWPAQEMWEKSVLLDKFGHRIVRSGSESSIVHSGGVAETGSTLADMIVNMTFNDSSRLGDSYVFDTTILTSIPEFKDHIKVPELFEQWDDTDRAVDGQVWRMLSLGPSRTGLPFHNHGKTWLGVVYGAKQWFVYPPGYDPPFDIDSQINPMLPVSDWLKNVYPILQQYSKPPLASQTGLWTETISSQGGGGFRPLECQQRSGDILFLPSRWTHMTINKGETIAIGGQETLRDEDRYEGAKDTLNKFPENYEAWKDLGLAVSNLARNNIDYLRKAVRYASDNSSLILLTGPFDAFQDLLEKSGDAWFVLYYDGSSLHNESSSLKDVWSDLAREMFSTLNVAMYDVSGHQEPEWDPKIKDPDHTVINSSFIGEIGVFLFDSFPIARLHVGTWTLDFSEALPDGEFAFTNVNRMISFLHEYMLHNNIAPGSIETVSVDIQAQFLEAAASMRQASSIKPLQFELLSMLGETTGLGRDYEAMHQALLGAAHLLDTMEYRNRTAPMSLASMYHKVAHAYIEVGRPGDALTIIEKALEVSPTFIPALNDWVYVFIATGNKAAAEEAIQKLMLAATPSNPCHDIERLKSHIDAMT